MAAAFRLVAFLGSAIGLELARGAGLATLTGALFAGLLRLNPLFAIAAVGVGTALSLLLPEDAAAAGKVAHGLSNAPVLILVHGLIAIVGFTAGRLIRFIRNQGP